LPQGDPERRTRALNMVAQMDKEVLEVVQMQEHAELCPKKFQLKMCPFEQEYLIRDWFLKNRSI
jgi:hypothetical protein